MSLRFTKLHGAGNDYIYIDCFTQPPPGDPAGLSRAISDRHRGVGGDGLILVLPPPDSSADARMRMFNPDGTESEMCGNGLRCLAKYVFDRGLSKRNPVRVSTLRGVLCVELHIGPDGKAHSGTTDMDEPILEPAKIPTTLETAIDASAPPELLDVLRRSGAESRISSVSMGSPHAVVFCRDAGAVPLDHAGPMLERASCFPNRINVHFATIESPDRIRARTWERGTGPTQACGTGACAIVVAAALKGRADRKATVAMPGGDLQVDWRENNHIFLTGPAAEVFSGEWSG